MASRSLGGAGLTCTDCHTSQNHRIAGRGVDLRPTDLDVPVRCTNCHTSSPHDDSQLNQHTDRVDCAVCHIPHFAKVTSTDMFRDYSRDGVLDVEKRLYEPYIERQANVVPAYRFWNGMSQFYIFGEPAQTNADGRVEMAGPVGSITDNNAKIYPFKHHLAVLPQDPVTRRILPAKLGILFQTGDTDAAIRQGASELGWALPSGYDFVNAERYMGIFHEVSPANEALSCDDCHSSNGRMDFDALGYTPVSTRNGRPLCSSCHESESGSFTSIHSRHVDRENINCSVCHTF
jgi:hypothetical protein